MRSRTLAMFLLLLALPVRSQAAKVRDDDEGVPVRITVVDEQGRPIPNAWVRVPDTEGRRIVEPETGVWEARYLYAYDGMEILFERGMTLEFTISAPGYSTRVARYRIRGGKNQLTVALPVLTTEGTEPDTNVTWFRRNPDGRRPERPDTPPPSPRPAPAPESEGSR